MAFLVGGANSAADTGYDIDNSLRFNDDDTAYLSFTPAGAGNRNTWTWSGWAKRGNLTGSDQIFFDSRGADNNYRTELGFNGEAFRLMDAGSGGTGTNIKTNAVCRDVSAWYHFVCAVDTTQGTDTNRVKLYINGSLQTLVNTDYPDQNQDLQINTTDVHYLGVAAVSGNLTTYFDGYLADVYFIDGTQYAASDFGETDEDSGIWKPKSASVTFGTNGFFMEFKQTGTNQDSSGIGADTSGNDNHFAVTNLAATDQCTDTPTNNFATWNPLGTLGGGVANAELTLAKGNTLFTPITNDYSKTTTSTFAITSGKWYAEFLCETAAGGNPLFGLMSVEKISTMQNTNNWQGTNKAYISLIQGTDGNHKAFGSEDQTVAYGDAISPGEIMMLAIDMDNGKIYFGEEGTWYNSGDPANETNPASSFAVATYPENVIFGQTVLQASGGYVSANFGNPSFSISSGNADANGYGNFEFAPPSGFYALCTKNLAEYG